MSKILARASHFQKGKLVARYTYRLNNMGEVTHKTSTEGHM